MLDVKRLRSAELLEIAERLETRGFILDINQFQTWEEQRKQLQVRLQELQNERNVKSKMIGQAKARGESADDIMLSVKGIGDQMKTCEQEFSDIQEKMEYFLSLIPNLPQADVPVGKDESGNVVVRNFKEPTQFDFTPKDHVDLGLSQSRMDFSSAAKITGARFVVLRAEFAALHRALAQFMLDTHIQNHGYTEIAVPYMVNADSMFGTGQFPKLKEDSFALQAPNDYYLIPTSEVPVTNLFRDEIIDHTQLPIKYTCYSACFRSEAGSYGKDMRGMLRQHQFEKVELIQIVEPHLSHQAHEELTRHAENILQLLELPYRVMALCTGDIGFSASKTYDLEVWLPSQQCYREISSCSNTESFQARRMKARYRKPNGEIELVHTLNGSGLAVGRTLIAVVENYQDKLGRIHIPKVLQPYMKGLTVIE